MSDDTFTVYLCGGINGLTDAECIDWRQQVKAGLREGIATLDPMRRDFRGVEGDHTAEIVEGDLEDIRRSHLVLANCARPSWGTAMEIRFAREVGVPVIAFNVGNPISPWVRFHTYARFDELSNAVHFINNPEVLNRFLASAARHR